MSPTAGARYANQQVTGGGGGGPSPIPNLLGQWDASDVSTITASAGAVSQWRDKSPNGFHMNQAVTGRMPITGTRTVNGLNCLDFNGVNSQMEVATPVGSLAAWTIFAVVQPDQNTTGHFYTDGGVGAAGRGVMYIPTAGGDYQIYAGAFLGSGITVSTNLIQMTGLFSGTTSSRVRVNGTAGTVGGCGSHTLTTFRCGTAQDESSFALDGRLCELVLVSGVAAAGDITAEETRLRTKWGTP